MAIRSDTGQNQFRITYKLFWPHSSLWWDADKP